MARQKGPIKIVGTLDDLTFLHTQDGYRVRNKSSLTAARIASDPNFLLTRQNGYEFARSSKAAKLMGKAFRSTIAGTVDSRMHSRLLRVMSAVLHMDQVHGHGARTVADGDMSLLNEFQFNVRTAVDETFHAPFTSSIDRVTGACKIIIPSNKPLEQIVPPQGATHFRLISAAAELDFLAPEKIVASASSGYLLLDNTATAALTLTSTVTVGSTLPIFLAFGIEFWKDTNGFKEAMRNGAYNAYGIVRLDA
jgi:hypothetical protein